jgi:hypothetical protein
MDMYKWLEKTGATGKPVAHKKREVYIEIVKHSIFLGALSKPFG